MVRSGLSNKVETAELIAEVQEQSGVQGKQESVEGFCDFLIAKTKLTAWQCNKLRMEKWKGFYLDNHVLLEQVGKDYVSSSYKARETTSGRLVVLVINPVNQTNGYIEYRVEPYEERP
jgi:hypothetical protein